MSESGEMDADTVREIIVQQTGIPSLYLRGPTSLDVRREREEAYLRARNFHAISMEYARLWEGVARFAGTYGPADLTALADSGVRVRRARWSRIVGWIVAAYVVIDALRR